MDQPSIFSEGRNCWRRTRAGRVAFLIDGEAYFKAFREAALMARRSILILSWDINSHVILARDGSPSELPNTLGDLLSALLSQRPDLNIYVLNWDFNIIYALERESPPLLRAGFGSHNRLHFHLDQTHPIGASHHQKIVVIDDAVAFTGGFDLTNSRWDTPSHRSHDPNRVDPSGAAYGPFHDVQIMVDGPAARDMGDLARERWFLATGQPLDPAEVKGDPWPPDLRPDMENASVAISRTLPAFMGRPEVREVEALYLDMIASARRFVYIEQQYFTSGRIGNALAERLREKDGPEIVVVLPRVNSGWLEENTMGVLRSRLLKRLKEADIHRHLGVYCPVIPNHKELFLNVHSKVMVIDDCLARVGSSNFSNRSMGLDTECDITIESGGSPSAQEKIIQFRDRLLAEHLGVSIHTVSETVSSRNSLVAAVEALRDSKRTLMPMKDELPEWVHTYIPETALFDPEKPMEKERLIEAYIPYDKRESAGRPLLRGAAVLLAMVILAGLWKWTPLKDLIDVETLTTWADSFRESQLAPLIVVGAYVLGGLVMFPVLLLIFATTLAFDPVHAIFYSLAGCLSSALAGYAIGRVISQDMVRRLAGVRLNPLTRRLARRGLVAIITVRILPILPFSVVNLIAGASHISLRNYLLGTIIGMTPGILLITLFQTSIDLLVKRHGFFNFVLLLAAAIALLLLARSLSRWFAKTRYVRFVYGRVRRKGKWRRWFSRKERQSPPA